MRTVIALETAALSEPYRIIRAERRKDPIESLQELQGILVGWVLRVTLEKFVR
jgi:hypothetical protein